LRNQGKATAAGTQTKSAAQANISRKAHRRRHTETSAAKANKSRNAQSSENKERLKENQKQAQTP
ncbi:hypothetical protein PQR34_35525, partial [Paraburkholderia sediminicola]|uniref:hypothetical protein n=1 Tax=Paraburkholderia sediminicola TaxID=458836 RepID=UPI0038BD37C9